MFEQLFNGPMWFTVLLVTFVLICGSWFYFLPAWIATRKHAIEQRAIFLVNVLFGWTIFGWVVALFWAFSEKDIRPAGPTPFHIWPRINNR